MKKIYKVITVEMPFCLFALYCIYIANIGHKFTFFEFSLLFISALVMFGVLAISYPEFFAKYFSSFDYGIKWLTVKGSKKLGYFFIFLALFWFLALLIKLWWNIKFF